MKIIKSITFPLEVQRLDILQFTYLFQTLIIMNSHFSSWSPIIMEKLIQFEKPKHGIVIAYFAAVEWQKYVKLKIYRVFHEI